MSNYYTVTIAGTYFTRASSESDALYKVYEAMLGNDEESILGWGEVDLGNAIVREGTHNTIERY